MGFHFHIHSHLSISKYHQEDPEGTLGISMSDKNFSLTEDLGIFTMCSPTNCGRKPLCERLGGIYVTITVIAR